MRNSGNIFSDCMPGKMVLFNLVCLVSIFQMNLLFSQNSDNRYNQPLERSIEKLEQIFQVKIKDDRNLLQDKSLDYADWRIRHGNLEVSLANLLAPLDLTFSKESDSIYKIAKFENHKLPEPIAEERLEYLQGLYDDKESWEERKEALKKCMETALLLDKAPEMPKQEPVLTSKRVYEGYSVENIALEVIPGVFTTGSIYKPYPAEGKNAIVLSPNGHFGDGRYREDQQIRSATLAKMGAIVVGFDLFAWGESQLQFPGEYHHQSIAQTVQVLNGLRLLDYLENLPEADPKRVGVTGGSGGGSHTLFLAALDDRIKVSVPAVMVSAHHSGGCPCESGRPIHLCGNGTTNVEIAAMAAPRPQLIISDGGDWTKNVPEVEFPFIERIYDFYGNEENIENAHFSEEGHDYGISKRMAMYPFMARHLELNLENVQNASGEIDESFVEIEDENQMKVFGENGEKFPANALTDIDELYALFGEKNQKK